MWWLLLILVFIYLAICAALYLGQTALLFPAGQVGPAGAAAGRGRAARARRRSGERLHGIHIPPARRPGARLLILGFGGNGWNAEIGGYLHGAAVSGRGRRRLPLSRLPPERGASRAAEALLADAPLIHDFAVRRLRPQRTVAVGFSIGSGVAASLAARRRLDGAILVTPFNSLARVAAGHYPWLPVRLLFRHSMEPASDLAGDPTRWRSSPAGATP